MKGIKIVLEMEIQLQLKASLTREIKYIIFTTPTIQHTYTNEISNYKEVFCLQYKGLLYCTEAFQNQTKRSPASCGPSQSTTKNMKEG